MEMVRPRSGALGMWDRLVGPGMTRQETVIVLAAGLMGAAVTVGRLSMITAPTWRVILVAVMAFDVVGGAVCNATATTKIWYAQSENQLAQRVGFIAPHLLYVALVAWLWRPGGFEVTYFAVFSIALVLSASAVMSASVPIKSPVAFASYLASLCVVIFASGLTRGLEWFAPALLLKLLIGHLVPETVR